MIALLFFFGLLTDLVWCPLVQSTVKRQPLRAAALSMVLAILVVGTPWIIITTNNLPGFAAYVLGCGVGTYLTTRRP
jgi:hypothetical protein